MKFINPVGVTPTSDVQARACVCNSNSGFADARGNWITNTCRRCGCHCASGNTANFNANHNIASNAMHKS